MKPIIYKLPKPAPECPCCHERPRLRYRAYVPGRGWFTSYCRECHREQVRLSNANRPKDLAPSELADSYRPKP